MSSASPSSADQQFLDDLDKKLWNAADRLRSNLDAAVYKHAVLGLIFLKYVSDAFDLRREELEASFRDPQSDYFLDRADYVMANPPFNISEWWGDGRLEGDPRWGYCTPPKSDANFAFSDANSSITSPLSA
jgi:type I restriction-modification system DNA methylase subunit